MNNTNHSFNQLKEKISTNVFYCFVFGIFLLACVCKFAEKAGSVTADIVNEYNLAHENSNDEKLFNNNK